MLRMLGVALIIGGLVALATTGFRYTRTKHEVDLGPIEVNVREKREVRIPPELAAGGVVLGGGLLLLGARRRRAA